MSLLIFVLCAFGLTQILVSGKIFDSIRPDKQFFKCSMCMGFWVGVFLWSINAFTELFTFEYSFINALLLGGLSSGVSYVLTMAIGDYGIRIEHLVNVFYRNLNMPGNNESAKVHESKTGDKK